MIIIGEENIAPYNVLKKASVHRNYDTNEKDEVDGIKISSVTKESKNDSSNTNNKSSAAKSKTATNKKKPIIRKDRKYMKYPDHKDQ